MAVKSKGPFGWGNSATKVAHTGRRGDQCRMSEVLKKNRVTFETEAAFSAAIVRGEYRACEVCARDYARHE